MVPTGCRLITAAIVTCTRPAQRGATSTRTPVRPLRASRQPAAHSSSTAARPASATRPARGASAGDGTYAIGATSADVNNDGDPDLYVTRGWPSLIYLNNGKVHFKATTRARATTSTTALLSRSTTTTAARPLRDHGRGRREHEVTGQPDQLMHGNGDGTLRTSAHSTTGLQLDPRPVRRAGFEAGWFHYNGDGRQASTWPTTFSGRPRTRPALANDGKVAASGTSRRLCASGAFRA